MLFFACDYTEVALTSSRSKSRKKGTICLKTSAKSGRAAVPALKTILCANDSHIKEKYVENEVKFTTPLTAGDARKPK